MGMCQLPATLVVPWQCCSWRQNSGTGLVRQSRNKMLIVQIAHSLITELSYLMWMIILLKKSLFSGKYSSSSSLVTHAKSLHFPTWYFVVPTTCDLKKKRCEKHNWVKDTENCQRSDLPSIQRLNIKAKRQYWLLTSNEETTARMCGQISLQHATNYNVLQRAFINWSNELGTLNDETLESVCSTAIWAIGALPTKYVWSSPPRTDFNAASAHWNRIQYIRNQITSNQLCI
jgi:hypothetical protein